MHSNASLLWTVTILLDIFLSMYMYELYTVVQKVTNLTLHTDFILDIHMYMCFIFLLCSLSLYVQPESKCSGLYRVPLLLAVLLSAYVLWCSPHHGQCECTVCTWQTIRISSRNPSQVTILNGMGVSGRIVGKVSCICTIACVSVYMCMRKLCLLDNVHCVYARGRVTRQELFH